MSDSRGSLHLENDPSNPILHQNGSKKGVFNATPRAAMGIGSCCAICCSTFLLLFFFIPRPPRAYLKSTDFSITSITQTYSVYNNNMYSLTLSDPSMTATFNVSSEYLVKTGNFANNVTSVNIGRMSNENINIVYSLNLSATEAAQVSFQCQTLGAPFTTQGTINMETWYHDFNGVKLGPWKSTWICSN